MRPGILLPSLLLIALAVPVRAQQSSEGKRLFDDGNTHFKSGDYRGAIVRFDSALAVERHEFYFYQRGLAQRKLDRIPEAIASFDSAVAMNPRFAAGYNALGTVHSATGAWEKAIGNFRKALEANPQLGPAKSGLAAAQVGWAAELAGRGDTHSAIELAQKALTSDPDRADAWCVIARACNTEGRHADAIKAAQKAVDLIKTAQKGEAWFEMGIAYRNLGNTDKAREAFLAAKRDPNYTRNAEMELKQLP
jgi:tetratricopeptide (TPR) repeat protein